MPQMMPLSWLTLYLFFLIILLSFSFINYYSFIQSSILNVKVLTNNQMNWKW